MNATLIDEAREMKNEPRPRFMSPTASPRESVHRAFGVSTGRAGAIVKDPLISTGFGPRPSVRWKESVLTLWSGACGVATWPAPQNLVQS